MPIDMEMLLSASNSFFPYSSYGSTSYNGSTYKQNLSFPHCVPRSPIRLPSSFHKKMELDGFTNTLSYKSRDKSATGQELFGSRKKKVSFADDKGLKLVEVREIPGAPKWADDVITLLIGSAKRTVVKEKKWRIAFDHPPWTDDKLIDAIESNMIALEHISVKEGADDYLTGTVKVKNLNFQKNVFLRVTFDRWLTYVDIPCTYKKLGNTYSKSNTHDIFYFNTKILPAASRYEVIEFCVCFQCDGKEYWDNNGGINYRLITEYAKSTVPELAKTKNIPTLCRSQSDSSLADTVKSAEDSWSKLIKSEAFW